MADTDTNISAIHGPIANISKILNLVFCLIMKNIMYLMCYLLFKNFKNQDLSAKIFQIVANSIFFYDF